MTTRVALMRQVHRTLAPIMFLPLLLTLVTGTLYQAADLGGKGASFNWLLELHKGNFGIVNFQAVYPFLNALGLLVLALAGIPLWFQARRKARGRSSHSSL